tara:strand:- start:93 stop:872 length:780 start_codon:yes stop_codon:yes gene_type:complete
MSCTNSIRSDEKCFVLAQKIITSLSEKYSFNADEAWECVSTTSIPNLVKRFKKLKKANNPLSSIKKPRTAFSFFTKTQRVKIGKANPKATFGELSKLVSVAWKSLSDKEMKTYRTMETKDKKRYEDEKTELLAKLSTEQSSSTTETTTESSPSTETSSSTEVPTTTTASSSKKGAKKAKKATKSGKGSSSSSSSSSTESVKKSGKSSSSKKAVGSYNVFQKAKRSELKAANPSLGLKGINAKLGEMWSALSAADKAVYV